MLALDDYSFFHTSEWAEVLSESYGYKPTYFCITEDGKIRSVIPAMLIKSYLTGNRLVSLPFSDFCEPLFSSLQDADELKQFMFKFGRKNKLKFIEFRSSEKRYPNDTEEFRTDLRHILFLDKTEDELFKNFSNNTKRNIHKAIKDGVSVITSGNEKGMKLFFDMQCETRKRHGLPPQPAVFYQNLYKYVIAKRKGEIYLAKLDDNVIAGAIFLHTAQKVLYKFGASLTVNNHPGANHLIMWEAIKKYRAANYILLDFGRTETDHQGLRRYKLGFNTDERIIYTSRYDVVSEKFVKANIQTSGLHNKIFNRSPIFLLKIIGNTLYRHIG